jgi:hypothetical protein
LSATFERFADGVMQVLSHYNWTHVSLLLDKSRAGLIYMEIATAIIAAVQHQNSSIHRINVNLFYTYSLKNDSIVSALELIQKSSRGKTVFTIKAFSNPKVKLILFQTEIQFMTLLMNVECSKY